MTARLLSLLRLITLAGVMLSPVAGHTSAVTIGSYYHESSVDRTSKAPPATGTCNTTNFCYWLFNVVPAGKQLVVTDVSCEVIAFGASADTLYRGMLTGQANGAIMDRGHYFQPVLIGTAAGSYTYLVRGSTSVLFKAGERPLIHVLTRVPQTDSVFHGTCMISGRIGNPPP